MSRAAPLRSWLGAQVVELALALLLLLAASANAAPSALTRLLRRETSTLATLESVTDWIVRGEQELDDATARRRQSERELGEADRRLRALEGRALDRRHHLRARMRSLYKLSRGGALRLLLEAMGEQELGLHLSYASLVLRRDVRELELFAAEEQRLASARGDLATTRARLRAREEELAARQAELARSRREQLVLLAKLQRSRRLQRAVDGELDSPERKLYSLLATLAWRVRTAGGFAARRGRLPHPVPGPIASRFGAAVDRARKLSLLRHGVSFRPPPRAQVRAVERGRVRLVGPLRGHGRVVLLEHEDGYFTLYGFLSEVAVAEGQELRRGQPLGRAGIDPLSGERATYFELRRGERPLDPLSWLLPRGE